MTKEDLNKVPVSYTFKRADRLKSDIILASLFSKGSLFVCKPVLLKYVFEPSENNTGRIQAAFSVPKKKFKRAVDRNKIKRQMRNAYRLLLPQLKENQCNKSKNLYLIFIYTNTEIMEYSVIDKAINKCITHLKMS